MDKETANTGPRRRALGQAMMGWALLAVAGAACAGAVRPAPLQSGAPGKETNTMKMQTHVKGQGAPLVLVGGGLTGMLSWVPFQERLAATRQVVRVQPLSVEYGLEARSLPPGYSVDMESAALAAAIADLGFAGPVDVVAWSYGAEITLDFALDHPERVRTLTLIEPPAFWALDATKRWDADVRRESDELRAFYTSLRGDITEDQLAKFLIAVGICPPSASPKDFPQWPVWVKHRRSLANGDAGWRHTDTLARLRAFTRPTLLFKGTGSARFLHAITDALAEALPNAKTIELPGGHAPQIVAMDDFLARLAEFQAGERPAARAVGGL